MRRAFTLIEMMMAVAITVAVVGGVGSAFVGIVKMSKTAMAEAELSVRMRETREKLLFHAAPPHDGKVWSGLLSGETGVESGVKIRTSTDAFDTLTGGDASQTIELVVSESNGHRRFTNDGDRYDERWEFRWLDPGAIGMLPSDDVLDDSVQTKKFLYSINLKATAAGVTRRERVVVPLFGKEQVKEADNVFHD